MTKFYSSVATAMPTPSKAGRRKVFQVCYLEHLLRCGGPDAVRIGLIESTRGLSNILAFHRIDGAASTLCAVLDSSDGPEIGKTLARAAPAILQKLLEDPEFVAALPDDAPVVQQALASDAKPPEWLRDWATVERLGALSLGARRLACASLVAWLGKLSEDVFEAVVATLHPRERRDPPDGSAYSLDEFVAEYAAPPRQWEAGSGTANSGSAFPSNSTGSSGPPFPHPTTSGARGDLGTGSSGGGFGVASSFAPPGRNPFGGSGFGVATSGGAFVGDSSGRAADFIQACLQSEVAPAATASSTRALGGASSGANGSSGQASPTADAAPRGGGGQKGKGKGRRR